MCFFLLDVINSETEMNMEHEATTRMAFFIGILVLVALGELLSPRRVLTMSKLIRWLSNLGVLAVGTLAVRLGHWVSGERAGPECSTRSAISKP